MRNTELNASGPSGDSLRQSNQDLFADVIVMRGIILNGNQAAVPQTVPKVYCNSDLRLVETGLEAKVRDANDNAAVSGIELCDPDTPRLCYLLSKANFRRVFALVCLMSSPSSSHLTGCQHRVQFFSSAGQPV